MDMSKKRCPICLNRFCCAEHKDQHMNKSHPECLKNYSQDHLLKRFHRQAERIVAKAQTYKAHIRRIEELTMQTTSHYNRLAKKRPHSEMDQQIVSRSVIIKSESRKILVPAHRLKGKTWLTNEVEPKTHTYIERKKTSPRDISTVKTSTPIIDNHLLEGNSQNTWNISQTSTICSYHTPSSLSGHQKASLSIYETPSNPECNPLKCDELQSVNSKFQWVKRSITSPRSIMSKISKYDNELGPSPNPNPSKFRRVTFSFSSANSSPLESVQEVENCKEIENDVVLESDKEKDNGIEIKNHLKERLEEINKYTVRGFQEDLKVVCNQPSEVKNCLNKDLSSPDSTNSGFINCVTNMIRSAVPIFAAWREAQTEEVNRAKRLRSPDTECIEAIGSPEHKRLCYPFDLRLNPIKARKPISGK